MLELRRVTGSQIAMPVTVAWYMPATTPTADLNGDGVVGAADLAILLNQWGTSGTADFNNDGLVNAADMSVLLSAWN